MMLRAAILLDNIPADLGTPGWPPGLSPREREIMTSLAEGMTYAACARRLGIAAGTVANMVSAVLHRYGVGGLIELYFVLGWLRMPRERGPR